MAHRDDVGHSARRQASEGMRMASNDDKRFEITRRRMMEAGAAFAILGFVRPGFAEEVNPVAPPLLPTDPDIATLPVRFTVNGQAQNLTLDPRTTLLDALREQLGLTGTKKGCDHGQCGACTVLVDGRRINACLTLAAMHDGEDHDDRGLGATASSCIRCRPPSCSTTASSAAIARRARSARRWACWPSQGRHAERRHRRLDRRRRRSPTPRSASG